MFDEKISDSFFGLYLVGLATGMIYPIAKLAKIEIENKLEENNCIVTVSKEDFFYCKDEIKKTVLELLPENKHLTVVIDGDAASRVSTGEREISYNYTAKQMLGILKFNEELKSLGMKNSIKFNEYFQTTSYSDLKTCWDIEQVVGANAKIDAIVNKIKEKNFSPYEAMVYIHKYITMNYTYGFNAKKNSVGRSSERNTSIVAALLKNKTICVGFTSLTKAIIDKLDMPGLKCRNTSVCGFSNNGDADGHSLALIEIQDDRYDISGRYFNDATFDCKVKKKFGGRGFAHFMYPVSDIGKIEWWNKVALTEGSITRFVGVYDSEETNEFLNSSENGSAIPIEKLEKALKKVIIEEEEFRRAPDIDSSVDLEIRNSCKSAYMTFVSSGKNPLIKEAGRLYNVDVKMVFRDWQKRKLFTFTKKAANDLGMEM